MSNPKEQSWDDWIKIAQYDVNDDPYVDLFDWNFYYIAGSDALQANGYYKRAYLFHKNIMKVKEITEDEL